MNEIHLNKFVRGALFLTLAGLISKILSAGYRIPLQNLAGDLGFYVYQQIYPILGIVIVLSLYGYPSAVSKITAELKDQRKSLSFKQFYFPILLILLIVNSLFFSLLYINAEFLAGWIGDNRLKSSFRLTAFTFLFIPFTSILRGVFQGTHHMSPTAYSQIGEQITRVFIIIISAFLYMNNSINVYQIGEAGALASMLGAVVAIVILIIFFIHLKPSRPQSFQIPWGYYIRSLLIFGIVASLNHMVLLIIQFVDVFTLVPGLMEYGFFSEDAMKVKGVFDRGQPLIQIGTVLGSSFALALIPNISNKALQKEPKQFNEYIHGALKISIYLSGAAVIGLILIFPETNTLLFQDTKGTFSLRILSFTIILSSITITTTSILQGLGYYKRTALFICMCFFIKWVLNRLFVPIWGITGSSLATVFSMVFLCVLVLGQLKMILPRFKIIQTVKWTSFFIACFMMVIYIELIRFMIPYTVFSSRLGLLIYTIFIVSTGALIYILTLLKFRAFTKKELEMLPLLSSFSHKHVL